MTYLKGITWKGWLTIAGIIAGVALAVFLLNGLYCIDRIEYQPPASVEDETPGQTAPRAYDDLGNPIKRDSQQGEIY